MAFPDTSSGVYLLYIPAAEGILLKSNLISSIKKHYSSFSPTQIEETDSTIRFFTRNSLLRFEYQVFIRIEVCDAKTNVFYEFGTQYLVSYSFIAVLASLVFSKMNFGTVFFSSICLILLLYNITNSHIRFQIKQLLRSCSPLFDDQSGVTSEMLRLQNEWALTPDTFPACGAKFTAYDRHCFSCGLKLNDNAKPHPSNSTVKNHKRLNYLIKSKKK